MKSSPSAANGLTAHLMPPGAGVSPLLWEVADAECIEELVKVARVRDEELVHARSERHRLRGRRVRRPRPPPPDCARTARRPTSATRSASASSSATSSGFDDPRMLAAALLHDTIEDTTPTATTSIERFGPEVARWVAALTKDMRLPHDEREAAYCRAARRRRLAGEGAASSPTSTTTSATADTSPQRRSVARRPPRSARYLDASATGFRPRPQTALCDSSRSGWLDGRIDPVHPIGACRGHAPARE